MRGPGRDCARRSDGFCDDVLGVSPPGEGVPDCLSLGCSDFRWNDGDVVGLGRLGDSQCVVHCRGVVDLGCGCSVLASALSLTLEDLLLVALAIGIDV